MLSSFVLKEIDIFFHLKLEITFLELSLFVKFSEKVYLEAKIFFIFVL